MDKGERNFFYYKSSDEYKREKNRLYLVITFAVIALIITIFNESLKVDGWSQSHWPFYDIELAKKIIRVVALMNIAAVPVLTVSSAYLINFIFYYKTNIEKHHKEEQNRIKLLENFIFIVYDLSFTLCVAKKINCALPLAINASTKDCNSSKCPMPDYCRNNIELQCFFLKEFKRCYSTSLSELEFAIENIKNTAPEYYAPLVRSYRYVLFLKKDNTLSKMYQTKHLVNVLGDIYNYYKNDIVYTYKIIEMLNLASNKYSSMLAAMVDSDSPAIIPSASGITKEEVLSNIFKEWKIN